jgi:hypothetical protein
MSEDNVIREHAGASPGDEDPRAKLLTTGLALARDSSTHPLLAQNDVLFTIHSLIHSPNQRIHIPAIV